MPKNSKYNFSINTKDSNSSILIADAIENILHDIYEKSREIIVVCIGTDRSTGDSLGPLIGTRISPLLKRINIDVFGTLHYPVHAKNLEETIKNINSSYKEPFIIAIDASLGKIEKVGYASIFDGPIRPGAGVNKSLPHVGDIGITGVVNVSGFMEYMVLQNTRLSVVMDIADAIASSIYICLNRFSQISFSKKA